MYVCMYMYVHISILVYMNIYAIHFYERTTVSMYIHTYKFICTYIHKCFVYSADTNIRMYAHMKMYCT